jgi:hypothetical protein
MISIERTTFGAQMEDRAFDSFREFLVRAIMFDIDRCGGSIFLTDAMHAVEVAVSGAVSGKVGRQPVPWDRKNYNSLPDTSPERKALCHS